MLSYPIDNLIMIGIGCMLCYIAIKKHYEPLLLLPIGFGCILINIPGSGLMNPPEGSIINPTTPGGIFWYIYQAGIITEIFPSLIFIAIGVMCDFRALFERPWLLIFAAAGQLGIFVALIIASAIGFSLPEAACIGIIGAMDGPTAIYMTSRYARHLLPSVSVAAYSYMSMVPIFQVPISKALTSRRERCIRMDYKPENYSKKIMIMFPVIVTLVTGILAPESIPLMGSLMLGNFMRESGVVERLTKASENELANIITLLLGITIGASMKADIFLNIQTILIFALGVIAFVSALSGGILFAKLACFISHGKVNPLIGASGVSAYPMAGRTAHMIGRQEDPDNWLLQHAIAVNTGGQIASVVAAGVILTLLATKIY
jgi:sodium ion-translocating decarboxylase beta subunit